MASAPKGADLIRFPPFVLDVPNARLYRDEEIIPLRGKTLAVLEYLVARPGRLVTKDELLKEIWPEVYVSEDVLVGCVHELRQVFGDTRSTARFVETVYRRVCESLQTAEYPPSALRPVLDAWLYTLEVDPMLDALRAEPGFRRLARRSRAS